jgi:ADP-heptose:LPS heptosyltransferase
MSNRVNWDYLRQIKDPYLILKIFLIRRDKSLKNINRILVVDPCLVGDFVVSLPALRTFIKNNKNSTIDLVVSPSLKELAERIRGVRKVFVAKSSTSRITEKTTKNKSQKLDNYGEIIVMRPSKEAYRLIKNLKPAKVKTPFFKVLKYTYIYSLRDALRKKMPIQRREIDFDILNQEVNDVKFEEIFNFKKEDYNKLKRFDAMKAKDKTVIIHTGPVWAMRAWENDKWAELIKKINSLGKFRFIFVGAEEAESDYKKISNKLDFKVYSLIGKTNIKELLLILRQSNYFIGVDSGPRNIAHLANLRSITLFGPAASGAIYMPWSKKDIVIDKSNGGGLYQSFFYKKNSFIQKITVDEVYTLFKKLISAKN